MFWQSPTHVCDLLRPHRPAAHEPQLSALLHTVTNLSLNVLDDRTSLIGRYQGLSEDVPCRSAPWVSVVAEHAGCEGANR